VEEFLVQMCIWWSLTKCRPTVSMFSTSVEDVTSSLTNLLTCSYVDSGQWSVWISLH